MTRPANSRYDCRGDFRVMSCPFDWALGGMLLTAGARFHWAEAALMVLDGAMPAGVVVQYRGYRYRVYADALYELDGDGNLVNLDDDTPAMRAVLTKSRGYCARWEVGNA